MFILEWCGPFNSVDELKGWECTHQEDGFGIYFISGKPPCKQRLRSYVGISLNKNGLISKRYSNDSQHHIHELKDREFWIGRFSDKRKRVRNNYELCETLLVSYLQPELNVRKKVNYPSVGMVLVNRWYTKEMCARQNRICLAQVNTPDVIVYDYDEGIWTSDCLKLKVGFDE